MFDGLVQEQRCQLGLLGRRYLVALDSLTEPVQHRLVLDVVGDTRLIKAAHRPGPRRFGPLGGISFSPPLILLGVGLSNGSDILFLTLMPFVYEIKVRHVGFLYFP